MRALRYDAYAGPIRLVDLPEPPCPDDGVVVQVDATGVCRSDWHAWQGHEAVPLPMVPGHEWAGTVVVVGPRVEGWRGGERVTAPFVCGCGRCAWCAAGQAQVCPDQQQPGFSYPGSFAERVAVPAADLNLVALPEAVEAVAAASLGCRFATAWRALTVHGEVGPGDSVAVHGCGGVGLSAVMIAVALGADVVAVDPAPEARERATGLGALAALDPRGTPAAVAAGVVAVTDGGARVSLDAVGLPATAAASVRCLRPRGRHVQVGLLLGQDAEPGLPMDLVVSRELSVHGAHGMPAADYPALLARVADGSLRPQDLVGRVVDLAAAAEALAAMGAGPGPAGMTVARPAG